VTPTPPPARTAGLWGDDRGTVKVVAHNVSTRYLAYLVDAVLGLVMLPFNLAHLGLAAYGVWMLTTSFTAYFAMLDLGYGGALVRFVAQYRARRDARALNEVLSTLSVVYAAIAAVTYLIVLAIAFNLDLFTTLTPEQTVTSRTLLLIIGANVALRFVFGVYGGVIVGFQRYHLNNLTSIATSVIVAAANVVVLLQGHGLVTLVAVTTAVRVLALLVYRLNAYRVFPGLSVQWRLFRRERLREVSGFGVFMLLLDTAYKVNYSTDMLVIGAWLGAPAVALWAPAQRLSELMLRLSNQLSDALFPIVVDCDASQHEAVARDGPAGRRRAGAPGASVTDGMDRPLVLRHYADRADPRLRGDRARRLRYLVGHPQRRGHAPAADDARWPDGRRQPRAQHRTRAFSRARRRGTRHGGSGRAGRRVRARASRLPASAAVVCGALPQCSVAGALAGCGRRALPRRQPIAAAGDLICGRRTAGAEHGNLFRIVPGRRRRRRPPGVPAPRRRPAQAGAAASQPDRHGKCFVTAVEAPMSNNVHPSRQDRNG